MATILNAVLMILWGSSLVGQPGPGIQLEGVIRAGDDKSGPGQSAAVWAGIKNRGQSPTTVCLVKVSYGLTTEEGVAEGGAISSLGTCNLTSERHLILPGETFFVAKLFVVPPEARRRVEVTLMIGGWELTSTDPMATGGFPFLLRAEGSVSVAPQAETKR